MKKLRQKMIDAMQMRGFSARTHQSYLHAMVKLVKYHHRAPDQLTTSKDRMGIIDARWGLDQAEAILKLRSLKVSGHLEDYWAFHLCREHERNYPSAPIPESLQKAAK